MPQFTELLTSLKALPSDRRAVLVVRSVPFGDIIEDDTRKTRGTVPKIERDWQFVAYGLCRAANGNEDTESALRSAGYV